MGAGARVAAATAAAAAAVLADPLLMTVDSMVAGLVALTAPSEAEAAAARVLRVPCPRSTPLLLMAVLPSAGSVARGGDGLACATGTDSACIASGSDAGAAASSVPVWVSVVVATAALVAANVEAEAEAEADADEDEDEDEDGFLRFATVLVRLMVGGTNSEAVGDGSVPVEGRAASAAD
jgi:hypothetical protein